MAADLLKLSATLGVTFEHVERLEEALTHRSYLNENPSWPLPNNERLEYLGDAVLELAVTEELYRRFPDDQEGRLTSLRAALVNYQMLATIARELSLDRYLYLSRGEARDTGKAREVILANAIEAVIGAVYLDQGYEAAKRLVETRVLTRIDEVVTKGLERDPKSMLQEHIQEERKLTPTYRVLKEEGPDHQRQFVVGVYFGDELIAEGSGTSKQEAEVRAAQAALRAIDRNARHA
ncbi:MAG: ribonuclease III [bacterium]|nr:ribonuclease III [bacterium]